LLVLFRLTGKRSLAQITTFDFILLLIISEATQQGLVGNDYSLINSLLVVLTLVAMDVLLSVWSARSERMQKILDDVPLVVLEDGKPIKERMERERIDETEILQAARELQGLERLDQIKYAVLERSGGITVIPFSPRERQQHQKAA
jgi:uncharacterized membrane protein YcaP (DUF421 family)